MNIRLKIILVFSLVFSIFFFFSALTIYSNIKETLITSFDNEMRLRSESLLSKIKVHPVIIPLPEENEKIKIEYSNYNNKSILYKSKDFPDNQERNLGVYKLNYYRIFVSENIIDESPSEKIKIYFAKKDEPIIYYLKILIAKLLFTYIFSIVISIIMSYILSSYILKPIKNIIDTANSTNIEDIKFISVKNTNDEIEQLSLTINNMLERIDKGIKNQNNFLASASHDLRTPIAIMKTQLEISLMNSNQQNDIKHILFNQLEEVNNLSNIVEDFLLINKIKNDNLQIKLESIDIIDFILEIIERLDIRIKYYKKNVKLNIDENYENYIIQADINKLKSLINNALENALKYSLPDSEILIDIRKNKYIEITISNKFNGDIKDLNNLKTEFYQASESNEGYGMGLWICNKIVEMHNWEMNLHNENGTFSINIIFVDRQS